MSSLPPLGRSDTVSTRAGTPLVRTPTPSAGRASVVTIAGDLPRLDRVDTVPESPMGLEPYGSMRVTPAESQSQRTDGSFQRVPSHTAPPKLADTPLNRADLLYRINGPGEQTVPVSSQDRDLLSAADNKV